MSGDCKSITFTDGFEIGTLAIFCNNETQEDLHRLKINRVRIVRRADGYYAQFCFDAERKEKGEYTGNVVGLDLGLKFFTKDQNDNAVIYPQFLRKSEKRLDIAQRRSLPPPDRIHKHFSFTSTDCPAAEGSKYFTGYFGYGFHHFAGARRVTITFSALLNEGMIRQKGGLAGASAAAPLRRK